MKLGLLSDIHCNLDGLDRALDLLEDCDEIWCAGDIMYQYRFSNAVLERLDARSCRSILGNHDKVILYSPNHPIRSSPTVSPEALDRLRRLPNTIAATFGETRVSMFHGAPWDDGRGEATFYIYPQDRQQLERLAEVEADIVILGHTHIPFVHDAGAQIVINPGSCGESRDGTGMLSCAMLDTSNGRVDFRRFSLR